MGRDVGLKDEMKATHEPVIRVVGSLLWALKLDSRQVKGRGCRWRGPHAGQPQDLNVNQGKRI